MPGEPPAWLIEIVRFYRELEFFADMEGETDRAVAQELQRRHTHDWWEPLSEKGPVEDSVDLDLLLLDESRVLHLDFEYGIPGEDMYSDLFPKFARISRGALELNEVRERVLSDKSIEATFLLDGAPHRYEFRIESDWLDPQVLSVASELLEARGLRLCWYDWPDHPYELLVAFRDGEPQIIERKRGLSFACGI